MSFVYIYECKTFRIYSRFNEIDYFIWVVRIVYFYVHLLQSFFVKTWLREVLEQNSATKHQHN